MNNNHRPYEEYGRFYAGRVFRDSSSTGKGRRVLCFVTNDGAVGASACFSRSEAFTNARRAGLGQVAFRFGTSAADTLASYLAAVGFPVRSATDSLDDESGRAVLNQLKNTLTSHA